VPFRFWAGNNADMRLMVFGSLKSGVTVAQASAEINATTAQIHRENWRLAKDTDSARAERSTLLHQRRCRSTPPLYTQATASVFFRLGSEVNAGPLRQRQAQVFCPSLLHISAVL
jgi:hypothetical protein